MSITQTLRAIMLSIPPVPWAHWRGRVALRRTDWVPYGTAYLIKSAAFFGEKAPNPPYLVVINARQADALCASGAAGSGQPLPDEELAAVLACLNEP